MARNDFMELLKDVDVFFASAVSFGPIRAAHRTVRELQQEGPSWTGRFSNSWKIETPDGRSFKGSGQPGEPQPLPVPALTGPQALKAGIAKDRIVFTISNFSPWAGQAVDFVDDNFYRPTPKPQTQLGLKKWEESGLARPKERHKRYNIYSESDLGNASRTADQDWFTTYVTSGKLDRTITFEMDNMFRSLPNRFR